MSDKYYIAIGSSFTPKKFFNRDTQGFTDIRPIAEEGGYTYLGANRLSKSGEPYKNWLAMCENAPGLTLWVISESSAREKGFELSA